VTEDTITTSPGSRFRAAMMLAIIADALQIVVFPLFVEGALSPADDMLDFSIAAVLVHLLGWHWEFLPSHTQCVSPSFATSFSTYQSRSEIPERSRRVSSKKRSHVVTKSLSVLS
jgi:hypothetical protein